MRRPPFLAALADIATVAPLAAQEAQCSQDYAAFEFSVPHTDLGTCPEALAEEGLFCRLSLVAEVATVVVFSEETDCLVDSRAFYEDAYTRRIG